MARAAATSFEDDVAATQRAIALQDGPMILVGHSWGGVVTPRRVATPRSPAWSTWRRAPDVGVPVGDLGKDYPPPPAG